MNKLSFAIKTAQDLLEKLKADYDDFLKDTTSSRVALNCAMTSWHLTEWIYHEYASKLQTSFPSLSSFQQHIKTQCGSLQVMHDIANGTKHYLLTRHTPIIQETRLHEGPYSAEYSREYDVSSLNITLNDGTLIYFEDEINRVVTFWNNYLQTM